MRIPHDDSSKNPPSFYLPTNVQADEDDISMLWLKNHTSDVPAAVATLQTNKVAIGADAGEIFYGPSLGLMFNVSPTDSRTPDVVVAPNVGVVYTGGGKKLAEHGGWANDDRNVMLLVSNPVLKAKVFTAPVATQQVASTILTLLGQNPRALIGVRGEGVEVLQGF